MLEDAFHEVRSAFELRSEPSVLASSGRIEQVPLLSICADDRYRVRSKIREGSLARLRDSIRQSGLLHPVILVREGSTFLIVAGWRRVEAFRQLGREKIEARVFEKLRLAEADLLALTENLLREDLRSMETALACRCLVGEGVPYAEIAKRLGIHPKAIQRYVRIVDRGTPAVLDAFDRGKLSLQQTLAILRLSPSHQSAVLEEAGAKNLKPREFFRRVRQLLRAERGEREVAIENEVGTLPTWASVARTGQDNEVALVIHFSSTREGIERLDEVRAILRQHLKQGRTRGAASSGPARSAPNSASHRGRPPQRGR